MCAKRIRNQEGELILNTGTEIQPKKNTSTKITLVSNSFKTIKDLTINIWPWPFIEIDLWTLISHFFTIKISYRISTFFFLIIKIHWLRGKRNYLLHPKAISLYRWLTATQVASVSPVTQTPCGIYKSISTMDQLHKKQFTGISCLILIHCPKQKGYIYPWGIYSTGKCH